MPVPDLFPSPVVAEQYELRRRLGEGGFGEVYEAWDPKLCRAVAVKRLKTAPEAWSAQCLLHEARLAASLKHSAFVKVYAIDDSAATQSIVMELVEGATLRQFAAGQALGLERALDVALQVADAMQEAHNAGLVHGDLKPSNLMIDQAQRVRILDFGLARQIDPLATQASVSLMPEAPGTIAYMAPERLLGRAPEPAGDVYALGAILYELLAGQRPFPSLNGLALAAARIQTSSLQWEFPPDLPNDVVQLVQAMTATDPARRTGSMPAVCAALRALVARDAVAVVRPSWPVRVRGTRTRRRTGLVLAGAVTLTGLVAGAVLLVQQVSPGWRTGTPSAPWSAAATFSSGMAALRSEQAGGPQAAMAAFSTVLEHEPRHAAAAAGLSLAYSLQYYGANRDETWLQRADASAQQALALDDQLALAHVARAWVLESQGKYEASLQAAQEALRLDPRNLFAWWGKADLLVRLRRYDAALQALDTAAALYPAERRFADVRGLLHYQRGEYAAAEQAFRHSIALDPNAVRAYASLNQVLLRQGRADEALQVLQEGLQIRGNSRLYTNLGTTLFARADYLGAATAFEQAVSAEKGGPREYLHWANLADTLRWIPGRAADARRAYRQALDLLSPLLARAPDDVLYQSRMGLYAARLGDHADALAWTARAVHGAPADAEVRFRAALVHEIAGDRATALAELRQAVAHGFSRHLIDTEPDLIALRRDARFRFITAEGKS